MKQSTNLFFYSTITETGNDYFEARFLDTDIGRFLSVDPLGFLRMGLNPYNYVQNNPINRVDPTGLSDTTNTKDMNQGKWDDFETGDGEDADVLSFPEGSVVIKAESTELEYGLWDYFGSDFSFSMYTAKVQNKIEQGINDINWGAVDAGIGIVGGGFEIASGIALAPFTGGLSTALIIDGAYRVGMNGFRMGAYMTNNSKIGDALPGNLGGMAGKLIDGMNGSSFYETGMAQSSMALTNDLLLMCSPFGTAYATESFVMNGGVINGTSYLTSYYSSIVGTFNNSKNLLNANNK